jgi:glycosyltransferase involved in cell wall biosynthesis
MRRWDVIHLHAFNLPLGVAVGLAGRPAVFTDHGAKPYRHPLHEGIRRRSLAAFLRRYVDALAANSRYTAVRTSQRYGVTPARVRVVHNGIAPRPDGTPRNPARGRGLVAVFLGRLVSFKRVEALVRAAAQISPAIPIRVLIVGEGPEGGELRGLAERLGVADRVAFLGFRSDVERVLRSADVLVHTSEGEPFGLAVIEACAQGLLPVVFADAGGALELLPPDGRVVNDVAELAAVLVDLVDGVELSEPAREARASWARRRFSIARTADEYGELYRAALKLSKAESGR